MISDRLLRSSRLFKLLLVSVYLGLLIPMSALAQSRALPDFVELAEKQSPSVVNISTLQNIRGKQVINGFPIDPELPSI